MDLININQYSGSLAKGCLIFDWPLSGMSPNYKKQKKFVKEKEKSIFAGSEEGKKTASGTELEELYTEARLAAWPADVRVLYEKQTMNRNDYENILHERYGDGHAEGHAEGLAEAIKKMVASGMSHEKVAEILDMSLEEVYNKLK